VAGALANGSKGERLASNAGVAAGLKQSENPLLLGTGATGPGMAAFLRLALQPNRPIAPALPPGAGVPAEPVPVKPSEGVTRALDEMVKATATVPSALLLLQKRPDGFLLTIRQDGLRTLVPASLMAWVEGTLESHVTPGIPFGAKP
jgi:hypothetical protein